MARYIPEKSDDDHRLMGLSNHQYVELVRDISKEVKNVPDCSLTAVECVEACLEFLSEGVSIRNMAKESKVEYLNMKKIIMKTCVAIRIALKDEMKPPSTERWKAIKQEIAWVFEFPHCIGFMDGLSLMPKKNSQIYTYIGTFAGRERKEAILYTLVDANCKFTMVEFCPRQKYGASFNTSNLSSMLEHQMGVPEPEYLPGFPILVPSVVLASESFPLKTNILRPFSAYSCDTNPACLDFNRRHELVGKCSSAALNLLEQRFRVLRNEGNIKFKYMEDICYACCYLHNYIMAAKGGVEYAMADRRLSRLGHDTSGNDLQGFYMRDKFRDFFRTVPPLRFSRSEDSEWNLQMINW